MENSISNVRVSDNQYDQRNCGSIDPNVFFPHERNRDLQQLAVEAGQRICCGCVIQQACLEGAVSRGEKEGIWGGVYFGAGSGKYRSRTSPDQF